MPIGAFWCSAFLLLIAPSRSHAATPISACGTTITKSGSYVVTKNLALKKSGGLSACILINTSFVSIDLGGFTIDCNGQPSATGILIEDSSTGVIIRKGVIAGCHFGINAESGALIEGVTTLANSASGISLGPGSLVTKGISNNNDLGIALPCASGALDNTVLGNLTNSLITIGSGCALLNDLTP